MSSARRELRSGPPGRPVARSFDVFLGTGDDPVHLFDGTADEDIHLSDGTGDEHVYLSDGTAKAFTWPMGHAPGEDLYLSDGTAGESTHLSDGTGARGARRPGAAAHGRLDVIGETHHLSDRTAGGVPPANHARAVVDGIGDTHHLSEETDGPHDRSEGPASR